MGSRAEPRPNVVTQHTACVMTTQLAGLCPAKPVAGKQIGGPDAAHLEISPSRNHSNRQPSPSRIRRSTRPNRWTGDSTHRFGVWGCVVAQSVAKSPL